MDNKTLEKILDDHKLWLETSGSKGRRANLTNANLRHANLTNANLTDANLRHANLTDADLTGANLRNANLTDANLRHANLTNAYLRGACLRGAYFRNADLTNADLRGVYLTGADLRDADLDFSAFPLWCGGLDVNIDDRQATQLLYHLIRNVQFSKNTSKEMKELFKLKSIVKKANEFHRVDECGVIE